jgi:hypothetical protein
VWTKLYELLLYLYPERYRSEFGAEMTSVFRRARAEACKDRAARRMIFYSREFFGLARDAFHIQTQTATNSEEHWVWSLEASMTAILLYSVCVWRAEEVGIWGFFFPGTYLLVALLAGIGAWLVGRECAILRCLHRWKRALVFFLILALVVPAVIQSVEATWARFLLAGSGTFRFSVPGISVLVEPGTLDVSRTPGLTFSRLLTRSDGRIISMVHHTGAGTPPYLFGGGLLVAAMAFWSRRTAYSMGSHRRLQSSLRSGGEAQ